MDAITRGPRWRLARIGSFHWRGAAGERAPMAPPISAPASSSFAQHVRVRRVPETRTGALLYLT